jgi:hypothetical protein
MVHLFPKSIPNLSQIYPGFFGKQAILFPRFGIDLGKGRFTSAGSKNAHTRYEGETPAEKNSPGLEAVAPKIEQEMAGIGSA